MNKKHPLTLKPYLINAFYTWCMDMGYTPMLKVHKHSQNKLPEHLQQTSELNFNIHIDAVRNFIFLKNKVEFEAMFGKEPYLVSLDYNSVSKIFNKETKDCLEFEITEEFTEKEDKPKFIIIKNDD